MNIDKLTKAVGAVVIGLGLLLLIAALIGLPVMWLWNWLMPDLFALKTLTFWQAVGLTFLCGCLFKSNSKSTD